MTRSSSPKLQAYVSVAALGLVGSLLIGRPELAAVAAPFAIFLVVGFALAPDPSYELGVSVDRTTAVEGELLDVRIDVRCTRPAGRLEVQASVPVGLDLASSAGSTLSLADGEMRRLTIPTRCTRWGSFGIGAVTIRAYDRLGLFRYDARREAQIALKVYPSGERLRTLVRPARTLRLVGSLISREHGEGIELAEVRPFRPGDRVRSMNWRASARRGDLWVTDRHPERNADVVIFVDAYTDLVASDGSSLEIAVRAAASIADAHLAVRDRVGLVTFGGALRWLVPGDGRRQLYRIVDALLDTQISLSYAWRDIDVLPVRTLPPRALVLALSPLLDERSIGALLQLAGRGVDLAVLELPPERFLPGARSTTERLARRIWWMERDVLRHRFERLGVPVSPWREDISLGEVLHGVQAFRRHTVAPRA
jgi:uncharacterized protein (DUF58 family)